MASQKGLLSSKNILKKYDRSILNQSYPMKYLFYEKNVSSGKTESADNYLKKVSTNIYSLGTVNSISKVLL